MHAKIICDVLEIFGSVLKKIKTIFSVFFSKIEGSLQKYHILMLNQSIDSHYNLELIEFEAYNTSTSISIAFFKKPQ